MFFVLGSYQASIEQSRVREIAKAWGPELFSEGQESRQLGQMLELFETSPLLRGSISEDDDVVVLGLTANGRVAAVQEQEDRFRGERLGLELSELQPGASWEGVIEAPGGERLTYIVVALPPAIAERQGFCCLAVAKVAEPRAAVLADLAPNLLVAGLVALVIAGLVGLALSRSIYRPVQRVAAAARSVARGRLQQRVAIGGSQEARELAQSFNQMTEEVERQQTALRDFLANVSHDLQTPLTSINGFSQALMDDVVEEDGRGNAYRIIEDESRRLLRLVEGLLDLSRIEAGQARVERAPVTLGMLMEHIGDLFALRAEELEVELKVEQAVAPDALGDWDRLEQVLGNLVGQRAAAHATGRPGDAQRALGERDEREHVDRRHGRRDSRRGDPAPVRPLLQVRSARRAGRHRARPGDRTRAGAGAGWGDRGLQRAGRGHHVPRDSARRRGRQRGSGGLTSGRRGRRRTWNGSATADARRVGRVRGGARVGGVQWRRDRPRAVAG